MAAVIITGLFMTRYFLDPAVTSIEAVESAKTGFLGGIGLPVLFSWVIGGLFAAGAAWLIGKVALGLRADYFAIATLGISEIIIAILKNEDWLTRGVKNVTGLPRPVPYEIELQNSAWFVDFIARWNATGLSSLNDTDRVVALKQQVIAGSSIFVKALLCRIVCYGTDHYFIAQCTGIEFALGPDDARYS